MAEQNAPLATLLSVVDAAGVAMAPPAERLDGSYMDAGNYSRSWAEPVQTVGSSSVQGLKLWISHRFGMTVA